MLLTNQERYILPTLSYEMHTASLAEIKYVRLTTLGHHGRMVGTPMPDFESVPLDVVPRTGFNHREHADGSRDSICTVTTKASEENLLESEKSDDCASRFVARVKDGTLLLRTD